METTKIMQSLCLMCDTFATHILLYFIDKKAYELYHTHPCKCNGVVAIKDF